MSTGESVFKIRHKPSGEWVTWVYQGGPNTHVFTTKQGPIGGIALTLKQAKSVLPWVHDCEIVEFTLSDPRVVEPT